MIQNLKKRFAFVLSLLLIGLFALSETVHTAQQAKPLDEAEILLNFFENERDYIHKGGSFVIGADALRTNILTKPAAQYIIDIRSPDDFKKGHIPGARHVKLNDVYEHVKGIDATSYENIVIVCFAGQASAYLVSLLRAAGYPNAISLKWGMSAWASVFAEESWLRNLSSARMDEFVHTESPPKNPSGPMPKIDTGKTTAPEILEARLQTLFAEGFGPVMLGHCCLFHDFYDNGGFYVINYWSKELYTNQGHIPKAVNYPPNAEPFRSGNDLFTLSTKIPNVIYCFTGQTSAYLAGYLRLLGYDARSILFGNNAMIYDRMKENKVPNTFLPETEIMNYDYATAQ